MSQYKEEDEDDNENQVGNSVNIKEDYEKSIKVSKDEAEFVVLTLKISKWESEVAFLSGNFHDEEIDGYEAKLRLLALLDLAVEMRDELRKTL